jgi:Icc-related predicted phosphoesterase
MPITLLAVADEISPLLYDHFSPDRWQAIDLIVSCGDLSPDYLDFLASSLNVPVFYVRGNHDGAYAPERYDGCENIHGRIARCHGLRIAGFEGSMRYSLGACQYTEAEMRRVVRRSRLCARFTGRPHIVITHAPAAGCHDGADLCHHGFECFRDVMRAWQPKYFIHGHAHAYERGEMVTQLGSTTVVNAYPYRVIQIPEPEASTPQ